MNYTITYYHTKIPDKKLLADLRKVAKKLGKKYVGYNEYDKEGNYSAATLSKRFGGWNEALIKAGLKVKKARYIPNDKLLENLKRVWDTIGRQPNSGDMIKPLSLYNRTDYKRHFGSWHNALKVFVKKMRNRKFKTPERVGDKKSIKAMTNACPKNKTKHKKEQYISKSMRFDVFKRDHFRCRICGASPANDPTVTLHVDHIIPVCKGGKTTLDNLQTCCNACNFGKGSKLMNDPDPR